MANLQTDPVEVLCQLLSQEEGDLFHFLAESDPYFDRPILHLRRQMRQIMSSAAERESQLARLIADLGGTPRGPALNPEHQYVSFLSMEFLLPRLVEAKRRSITRYREAQARLGEGTPASAVLAEHLQAHERELEVLNKAMESIGGASGPSRN